MLNVPHLQLTNDLSHSSWNSKKGGAFLPFLVLQEWRANVDAAGHGEVLSSNRVYTWGQVASLRPELYLQKGTFSAYLRDGTAYVETLAMKCSQHKNEEGKWESVSW